MKKCENRLNRNCDEREREIATLFPSSEQHSRKWKYLILIEFLFFSIYSLFAISEHWIVWKLFGSMLLVSVDDIKELNFTWLRDTYRNCHTTLDSILSNVGYLIILLFLFSAFFLVHRFCRRRLPWAFAVLGALDSMHIFFLSFFFSSLENVSRL